MSDDEDFEDDFYEDFDMDDDGEDGIEDSSSYGDDFAGSKSFMSNPIVKIGVVFTVVVGLTIGFLMMPDDSKDEVKTVLRVSSNETLQYIPGQEKLDPAYKKALEESNRKEAERAAQTGGSALPAPVGMAKSNNEDNVSDSINSQGEDPLEAWRRNSKQKGINAQKAMGDGDDIYGSGSKCVPDLDQCKELLKASGLLEEMCREALEEAGLLDGMCRDYLGQAGMDEELKVDQCRKLLRDAGVLGGNGGNLMSDGSNILGQGDGLLRDTNGDLILDENGSPINMHDCEDTEYLRDANCNLILGPDGKPIKKSSDGFLRDASGNLILDENGNPVAMTDCEDTKYLRDENCNLILGADGKPILKNGGADGYLRDVNGDLILDENGKPVTLDSSDSSSVDSTAGMLKDVNGNLILDENGNSVKMHDCEDTVYERDANCNLILGADGKPILRGSGQAAAVDMYGAAGIGAGAGFGSDGTTPAGMASFVDPNRQLAGGAIDPEKAAAIAERMAAILETQVPEELKQAIITTKPSPYAEMMAEEAMAANMAARSGDTSGAVVSSSSSASSGDNGSGGDGADTSARIITPAGEIFYAQVLTEVNSDVPGVVLARILTGPFEGGKAIGSFSLKQEQLTLSFETIVKDDVSYSIDAVALDQDTSLPAMATEVDQHYFSRIILPAIATFIEGYSGAIAETGTKTTEDGDTGDETKEEPDADPKESLYAGFEEAAGLIADEVSKNAQKPVTVKIKSGTTFGLLFLSPVTVGNAM